MPKQLILLLQLWKVSLSELIKTAIEARLDDAYCTLDSVLEDNAHFGELAQEHNANYVFVTFVPIH